ncbi:MAG TPA: isoprenylcysteine carboxylmethyltransferase family protein [Gemmatimonadaceae bacterium]|nr:isoprenylcysteine carboxylmethyltransferase family protein [Gemmatimonadaceae bacterium]
MDDDERRRPPSLLSAIAALLVLPGTIAVVVPLVILRDDLAARRIAPEGVIVLILGGVVVLWCVRDFFVTGRGTLAPWSPPRRLVRVGLYRRSRNPMYVGVLLTVAGWAIGFRSLALAAYALILAMAFHLRVVLGEEPWLARTHGAAWEEYRSRVPRWL